MHMKLLLRFFTSFPLFLWVILIIFGDSLAQSASQRSEDICRYSLEHPTLIRINRVARGENLSQEEMRELLRLAQTDPMDDKDLREKKDAAILKIVIDTEGAVVSEAKKFVVRSYSPHVSLEDLIQEGHKGVLEAIQRFDLSTNRKNKFLTYAMFYIRLHIRNAAGERQHGMRMTSSTDLKRFHKVLSEQAHLKKTLGRDVPIEEALRSVIRERKRKMSESEIRDIAARMSAYISPSHSLDTPLESHSFEKANSLGESLTHKGASHISDEEAVRQLWEVIRGRLTLDEVEFVEHRFTHNMSLQQIADQWKVSKDTVRTLKEIALRKLKSLRNDIQENL